MIRTAFALTLFSASISTSDFALACGEDWNCPRASVRYLTDDNPQQCDVRCDEGVWMPTPRLECLWQSKGNGMYTCEVWPQAHGMIYKWKGPGGRLALAACRKTPYPTAAV